MAHVLLPLVLFGGCALLAGVILDRASPARLKPLTDFPFKNMPATNGTLVGLLIAACFMLIACISLT